MDIYMEMIYYLFVELMRELNTIIKDKNQLIWNEKFIEYEKNELIINLSNLVIHLDIGMSKLYEYGNKICGIFMNELIQLIYSIIV